MSKPWCRRPCFLVKCVCLRSTERRRVSCKSSTFSDASPLGMEEKEMKSKERCRRKLRWEVSPRYICTEKRDGEKPSAVVWKYTSAVYMRTKPRGRPKAAPVQSPSAFARHNWSVALPLLRTILQVHLLILCSISKSCLVR